jgi:arylsulfatase
VTVDPLAPGASGVLCATGDWSNGWALVMLDGHLAYLLSRFGVPYRVQSEAAVPAGVTELAMEYLREEPGGGTITLSARLDGQSGDQAQQLGSGRMPRDLPFRWQIGGARFSIGQDQGFPVSDEYSVPFPFTGKIHTVEFEIPALAIFDSPAPGSDADVHAALAAD